MIKLEFYLILIIAFGSIALIKYVVIIDRHERDYVYGRNEYSIAAVYAGRNFHEEVTASMACMLQELGYEVVVYIENGFSIGGWVVPLTHKRLYSSQTMYGNCVSQFITINSAVDIVSNPEVLMFITYPVDPNGHAIEKIAFHLLDKLNKKTHDHTKLMLVVHHADKMLEPYQHFEPYFSLQQTTFLCLAEHTYKSAKQALINRPLEIRNVTPDNAYDIRYLYPVFSMDSVMGARPVDSPDESSRSALNLTRYPVTYSIQGNFGGVHSKRKNLGGTIQCMNSLKAPRDRLASVSEREDADHDYLRRGVMVSVKSVQLNLVGHVNGVLELSKFSPLPHLQIRSIQNLAHKEFYQAIASTHFLVGALGNPLYTSTQASSSIPAAMIAGVPLVLGADILSLYPCVRDAPVHQMVNEGSECDAIHRAFSLSNEQYSAMRGEIRHCARQLWDEALATLRSSVR